jgi:hypothetical protein
MLFAPGNSGQARDNVAVGTSQATKTPKKRVMPLRLRSPHELAIQGDRLPLPFTSPSITIGDEPRLLSVPYRSSYPIVFFAPNPLVSSPYKATLEYDYLYTAALISRSPPPLTTYKYRADNSYLLRPAPAYQVTAWAYQWTRATAYRTAIRASRSFSPGNEPATSRRLGQKIDNELTGPLRAILPRDGGGPWRGSPIVAD